MQAWELWRDNKIAELVDPVLSESSPTCKLLRYINIALLCVQDSANDRPTMVEVVSMLSNETSTLPFPKQPAFCFQVNLLERASLTDSRAICSVNDCTVSDVEAR